MLLLLIEERWPLDEVVFYDTGMEFKAIYHIRDKIVPLLEEKGVKYTELHPGYDFEWKMFDKPVNGRNGFHYGYSWCGGKCRWGTERIGNKTFPLAIKGMTEADCLRYCYGRGFFWEEETERGTVRLYDILDRVSCWCCANKNLKELRNIYLHLPEYWRRLEAMQYRTDRPMKGKGKSVFELKERFENERK